MQFGKGWDPIEPDNAPVDLNSAIRELQKLDADVLLLQEVEEVDRRRGQIDPPPNYTRLQQAFAGYDSVFAYPAADPQELPFGYGLAIFSKTALDNFFQVELPAPPIEFSFEGRNHAATSRLLIGAQTSFDGQPLQLFNTHLQAFSSSTTAAMTIRTSAWSWPNNCARPPCPPSSGAISTPFPASTP